MRLTFIFCLAQNEHKKKGGQCPPLVGLGRGFIHFNGGGVGTSVDENDL